MISFVNFSVSSSTGYVGITPISFFPTIYPITKDTKVTWYFGDGSSSSLLYPTHTYSSAGSFQVKLVAYSPSGDAMESQSIQTITITLTLNESIYFERVPPPTHAGFLNAYPFKLVITSPDTKDHFIQLSTLFSRSSNPGSGTKWNFLRPETRFYDLNGNQIQTIKTIDTILHSNSAGKLNPTGSYVAGVSGYAEFYFSDDLYNMDVATSSSDYTTILATLLTDNSKDYTLQTESLNFLPSYANSKAVAVCPYVQTWKTPDILKITENGIREHANPRWSTSKVPIIVNATYSPITLEDPWLSENNFKFPSDSSYFVHSFPLKNEDNFPIEVGLIGLSAVFNPEPYFNWTDYSNYKTPGYYKGQFDANNVNTLGVCITAALTAAMPPLTANFFNPLLWLSNPENGSVTVAQYSRVNLLSSLVVPPIVQQSFEMPVVTSGLSGFHGIYSIAALPYPYYQAWMLDSELSYLYRIDSKGDILSAIDINDLVTTNLGITGTTTYPIAMSLDSQQNIWLTLSDSVTSIKLDSYGNFLTAINPSSFVFSSSSSLSSFVPWLCAESYFPTLTSFLTDEIFIEPTFLDIDINDNIFICYSNPLSSFIVQYKADDFSVLYAISLPALSTPSEIVCDNNRNVWISLPFNQGDNLGYIERRNSTLTLLSSAPGGLSRFGPYQDINNLTIDNNQNLWFTHDYRSVSKITVTNDISGNELYSTQTVELFTTNSYLNADTHVLEGICSDLAGRIYVINSMENCVYLLDNNSVSIVDSFVINPQGFVHYLDVNNKNTLAYGRGNKSLQANGDWSGFRWTNKFGSKYLSSIEKTTNYFSISGISRPLDFYADNSYAYGLTKINEDFDMASYMKKLAFMPILQDCPVLFDDFFASILGNKSGDLGTNIYEKIANFVSNNVDIDTCNIDQLYSLSQMVDLNTDDFLFTYPESIKRLMNLISINQSRLRGAKDSRKYFFKSIPGQQIEAFNKGPIYTSSMGISAGELVILKNKSIDEYQLIYTGNINNFTLYSTNMLASYINLPLNWAEYYEFYKYISLSEGKTLEGMIDWENPFTTINYKTSSKEEWQGNEGIYETLLTYELYKGLNLLNY